MRLQGAAIHLPPGLGGSETAGSLHLLGGGGGQEWPSFCPGVWLPPSVSGSRSFRPTDSHQSSSLVITPPSDRSQEVSELHWLQSSPVSLCVTNGNTPQPWPLCDCKTKHHVMFAGNFHCSDQSQSQVNIFTISLPPSSYNMLFKKTELNPLACKQGS